MSEKIEVPAPPAAAKLATKLAAASGLSVAQILAWIVQYGPDIAKLIVSLLGKTPAPMAAFTVPTHVKTHVTAAKKNAAVAYASAIVSEILAG